MKISALSCYIFFLLSTPVIRQRQSLLQFKFGAETLAGGAQESKIFEDKFTWSVAVFVKS